MTKIKLIHHHRYRSEDAISNLNDFCFGLGFCVVKPAIDNYFTVPFDQCPQGKLLRSSIRNEAFISIIMSEWVSNL